MSRIVKKIPYFAFVYLSVLLVLKTTNAEKMTNEDILKNNEDTKEDCQVHQIYITENWPKKTLTFLAFIEHGESITCKLAFHDQNKDLVYDHLILSNEQIKLYKVRNGIVNETTFSTFVDTAGWTLVEMSMSDQFMVNYWNTTAFNYSLDQSANKLIVHGSNITVCKEKSPTWIVKKGLSTKIPLEPSRQVVNPLIKRTHVLTLQSDDEFTPCIIVDGNKKCLELNNYKFTTEPSLLRSRIFDLHLEIETGFINVYQEVRGIRKDIASLTKQGMKFIEVTSDNSTFSVSLNVFGQPKSAHPMVIESVFIENVPVVTEASDNKSSNSGYIAYMFFGIVIGISLCVTVIVYVKLRQNDHSSHLKDSGKDVTNKKSTILCNGKTTHESSILIEKSEEDKVPINKEDSVLY